MDFQQIDHGGGVREFRIARLEQRNALSWQSMLEFEKLTKSLSRDPQTQVLMVSGEGSAFCAGGDFEFLRENTQLPSVQVTKRMERFYKTFLALRSLPQTTLAVVNGPAMGAGLCLALACDLRVVLASAKLGFNFLKIGLNPGMGAWPLARAVLGEARARALILSASSFSGANLHAWGGASLCVADEATLRSQALLLARELAQFDPLPRRLAKQEMQLSSNELGKHLRFEAQGQAKCFKVPAFAKQFK